MDDNEDMKEPSEDDTEEFINNLRDATNSDQIKTAEDDNKTLGK